jgi:2-(1,2-epoxy-1,2-dihydrophenyl)acetyl-CoA isomerase
MGERYSSTEGLDAEVGDSVLRLTLNRPKQRNALDDVSMAALIGNLETASTDDDLRAVLLSGGENFCSGFDIVGRNAQRDVRPRTGSIQRRLPTQANRLIPLLLALQLPVVCAVRGWAVGIGAQLSAVADFTVTARDAVFWYPFLQRGFTPDSGSTWLLPRIVGPARARELLILGRKLTGEEAVEWGLAHSAVDGEDVLPTAVELARTLSGGATVSIGLTKALLNAAPDNDLHHHLAAEADAMELRHPEFGGR